MSIEKAKAMAKAVNFTLITSDATSDENGYAASQACDLAAGGDMAAIAAIDALLENPKYPLGNPISNDIFADYGDGGRIAIADALKAIRVELSI